ncbi:MAG TPA: Rrf2 family transcriptional regulator [Acidimicrobiales bacterium]
MRVGVKTDYGVRALTELAARPAGEVVTLDTLALALGLSPSALPHVMRALRLAGLITGRRGTGGGFRFKRPPEDITVADVIQAVEGQLVTVGDNPPMPVDYSGTSKVLREVWLAATASVQVVLESVTVADLAAGRLPPHLGELPRPAEV